jgi:Protein of unknown function (DUF3768)
VDKRAKIIELNDQLRTTFKGGRVQMTRGVYDLDQQLRGRALSVMARYHTFDAESEHDCGVFIFAGYAFEWRIEYRDKGGIGCSPDPADSDKTQRVLTLYATDDVLAHTG